MDWSRKYKQILLLGLISLKIAQGQDVECASPKVCTRIELTHSVQIKTHCDTLNIIFRNMTEETLPVGMFRLCRMTLIVDMSNNGIRTIRAGAFLGLSALQQLYLANNLVDRIEPGTFHTLNNLEVFVMTGNRITTIPEYEFTSKALRFFNINNNKVRRIPATGLLNLVSPSLVDLSLNDLEALNPLTLSNVRPGAKIILNNNKLKNASLTFHLMPKSKESSVLEVSGNEITSLTNTTLGNFHRLRLSSLDLSFNRISRIQTDALDEYSTLRSLHLSHNRIGYIHAEQFRYLINLNFLDLSYNQLQNSIFDVKLPGTIMSLNYSHNRIDAFREYHWSSKLKRNYMYLDISNNSISYLDAQRFCRYMWRVNLAYNKWKCSELYAIVHTLHVRGVQVVPGQNFWDDNVDGIPCEMGVDDKKLVSLDMANLTKRKHTAPHNFSGRADSFEGWNYFNDYSSDALRYHASGGHFQTCGHFAFICASVLFTLKHLNLL